ncbi:unnamed protein product, partial [Mesorhabditis spiculigera]
MSEPTPNYGKNLLELFLLQFRAMGISDKLLNELFLEKGICSGTELLAKLGITLQLEEAPGGSEIHSAAATSEVQGQKAQPIPEKPEKRQKSRSKKNVADTAREEKICRNRREKELQPFVMKLTKPDPGEEWENPLLTVSEKSVPINKPTLKSLSLYEDHDFKVRNRLGKAIKKLAQDPKNEGAFDKTEPPQTKLVDEGNHQAVLEQEPLEKQEAEAQDTTAKIAKPEKAKAAIDVLLRPEEPEIPKLTSKESLPEDLEKIPLPQTPGNSLDEISGVRGPEEAVNCDLAEEINIAIVPDALPEQNPEFSVEHELASPRPKKRLELQEKCSPVSGTDPETFGKEIDTTTEFATNIPDTAPEPTEEVLNTGADQEDAEKISENDAEPKEAVSPNQAIGSQNGLQLTADETDEDISEFRSSKLELMAEDREDMGPQKCHTASNSESDDRVIMNAPGYDRNGNPIEGYVESHADEGTPKQNKRQKTESPGTAVEACTSEKTSDKLQDHAAIMQKAKSSKPEAKHQASRKRCRKEPADPFTTIEQLFLKMSNDFKIPKKKPAPVASNPPSLAEFAQNGGEAQSAAREMLMDISESDGESPGEHNQGSLGDPTHEDHSAEWRHPRADETSPGNPHVSGSSTEEPDHALENRVQIQIAMLQHEQLWAQMFQQLPQHYPMMHQPAMPYPTQPGSKTVTKKGLFTAFEGQPPDPSPLGELYYPGAAAKSAPSYDHNYQYPGMGWPTGSFQPGQNFYNYGGGY